MAEATNSVTPCVRINDALVGPFPHSRLDMPLQEWRYESCTLLVATGSVISSAEKGLQPQPWATIYFAVSKAPGCGHASTLLPVVKAHYEAQGRVFGSTVAMSDAMRHLLVKFGIHEYTSCDYNGHADDLGSVDDDVDEEEDADARVDTTEATEARAAVAASVA